MSGCEHELVSMSGIVACTQFEEEHLTGVASDRIRLGIVCHRQAAVVAVLYDKCSFARVMLRREGFRRREGNLPTVGRATFRRAYRRKHRYIVVGHWCKYARMD